MNVHCRFQTHISINQPNHVANGRHSKVTRWAHVICKIPLSIFSSEGLLLRIRYVTNSINCLWLFLSQTFMYTMYTARWSVYPSDTKMAAVDAAVHNCCHTESTNCFQQTLWLMVKVEHWLMAGNKQTISLTSPTSVCRLAWVVENRFRSTQTKLQSIKTDIIIQNSPVTMTVNVKSRTTWLLLNVAWCARRLRKHTRTWKNKLGNWSSDLDTTSRSFPDNCSDVNQHSIFA